MTNKAISILMIFVLTTFVYTQQKTVVLRTEKRDVRIDPNKPTVYISFERFDEPDSFLLRLHNNSRWTISFQTNEPFYGLTDNPLTWSAGRDEFGLLDGVEVTPKYLIERLPSETSISNFGCLSSQSWLSAGRSIVFRLSRRHLEGIYKLSIMFTYEWEGEGLEPEHRVTFVEQEMPNKTNN